MILGTDAIRRAIQDGAIICDPPPQRVEGAHIDVTLGAHSWVFAPPWTPTLSILRLDCANPDEWFIGDKAQDAHVAIPAHGFVLAHTAEYIGTAPGSGLVPMLHTRSTLARWGLSVCTANAGQGDEGYCSRWTLEIVNPHPVAVALPVGARVGSISFHRVEGAATPYAAGTRYNATAAHWEPADMLPRKGNWS
jgi:deoxycytidine triphosphate deaminase